MLYRLLRTPLWTSAIHLDHILSLTHRIQISCHGTCIQWNSTTPYALNSYIVPLHPNTIGVQLKINTTTCGEIFIPPLCIPLLIFCYATSSTGNLDF